jgi:hypothetical protein
VRVEIKKTLRVDLTRIIVGSTRTGTVQVTTQCADSTCKVYALMHVESSRMRVKSTRSMVRLQCRAVCCSIIFQTAAGMRLQLRIIF